jgi:hypothetical protein
MDRKCVVFTDKISFLKFDFLFTYKMLEDYACLESPTQINFFLLRTASLKGQSHEKVYEFLTWDGSFSLN